MKIAAMIPVRENSKRLKGKNFLELNGSKIYEIALKKCVESNIFDLIFVNSSLSWLEHECKVNNISHYYRPDVLSSSDATTDQVVLDAFLNFLDPSYFYLFWVNTASPLSSITDIRTTVNHAINNNVSSIMTVAKTRGHVRYAGKSVNYEEDSNGFAQTQRLESAILFNYAVMGWSRAAIADLKARKAFNDRTEFVETSFFSNMLLKTPLDFDLISRFSGLIAGAK